VTRLIKARHRVAPIRRPGSRILAAKKITYSFEARGRYRIFNAAEYRFYRSNSAPPVEGDTPFATNATLPYEPADTYADGTWYLSASYFNGIYDSGFLPLGAMGETYLRLDLAAGVETAAPPAGPLHWQLQNVGGGVVRIVGLYAEATGDRAGQWSIAYTVNGSTPPTDTPDVTQNMPAEGLAVLSYDLPAQANGTTVKVRLQTRRFDIAYIYSENSEVQTATADAAGPAAVQVLAEGGS